MLLSGIEQLPNSQLLQMGRLSPEAIENARRLFGFNEITVQVRVSARAFFKILPRECLKIARI